MVWILFLKLCVLSFPSSDKAIFRNFKFSCFDLFEKSYTLDIDLFEFYSCMKIIVWDLETSAVYRDLIIPLGAEIIEVLNIH